jgi:3-dehydroquinate synthase
MSTFRFKAGRSFSTEYRITDAWQRELGKWVSAESRAADWSQIAVVADAHVWESYADALRNALCHTGLNVVPVTFPPGESAKELDTVERIVDELIGNRIHRRDLLICLGGGVTSDMGGVVALLYMRGMPYILLPTSLMAQIDAAIGGKVAVNRGIRKNLLGGFHHPLCVFIDPAFLGTLPERHFISGLAEAVKVATITGNGPLLAHLEEEAEPVLNRERATLVSLAERCIRLKLNLLAKDPHEKSLDRALNLGHAVAHSLERLPRGDDRNQLLHGEAVAIGLAAVTRYAFLEGLCSVEKASRLIRILSKLGLPITPGAIDRRAVRGQLERIVEHRGGALRLVVPVEDGHVKILTLADIDGLTDCLYPVAGLPL